jgi:hypothetical protein
LQTRVESSGLPKTRCRLRIDLEPASIWGMSVNISICRPGVKKTDSYGSPANEEDRETVGRLIEEVAPGATFAMLQFFNGGSAE